MTEHPNTTLVRRLHTAFTSGDIAALPGFFAADAIWELPGRGTLAGEYKGPEAIVGFLGRSFELSGGTLRLELLAMMGDDWGAVHVQQVSGEHGGRRLDCIEVLAHRVVDGKIVHTYHRPDQYAVDAFFG
ncbi:MAG: nuclear transport factor 2 family protein [Pseudonocardia sp.]|nr:nuclear transport factor 2 family protein [Pseudonocardia sp.]